MRDLPRSARPLGRRSHFQYVQPASRSVVTWLAADENFVPVDATVNIQTIASADYAAQGAADIRDPREPGDVLMALLNAMAVARAELGKALRTEQRVVDIGQEPEYHLQVVARAVVPVWPIVPGVTGPDWELLDEELIPVAPPADRIAVTLTRMSWLTDGHQRNDHRQVVWAVHPQMEVPVALAGVFTFVRDERVPMGAARLARMI